MRERETIIRLWFDMWLRQTDLGIDRIFAENAVYVESWGPQYAGSAAVKLWFEEWNTRGKVLAWEIRQFFHGNGQTVAEWYFMCRMNDGTVDEFDGMSLVRWTGKDQIAFLQEFGCNVNRYDPYQNGAIPQFRKEAARWF